MIVSKQYLKELLPPQLLIMIITITITKSTQMGMEIIDPLFQKLRT